MARWTPERHEAAKQRCDVAALGPWTDPNKDKPAEWFAALDPWEQEVVANTTFIAHAQFDLPDALTEIERLQAERDTILNAMRTRPDRIDEFLAWYDEQKQEAVNG